MHIPDGFLSAPVAVATAAPAAAGVGWALSRLRPETEPALTARMGLTAAFVFAAQMVNFPVAGGTSGHLLGAVLAAVLLGPTAATVALAAVFLIQTFFFLDGGHTALGANVLNMGLAGTLGGYAVYRAAAGPDPTRGRCLAAAGLAAWVAVLLGAGLAAAQLALSGAVPARVVLPAMLSIHAVIGVGEAAITSAALGLLWGVRPDLITARAAPPGAGRRLAWVLAGALAVVAALAPVASAFPDGLEWVAEETGFAGRARDAALPGPAPDYALPGLEAPWAASVVSLAGAGLMVAALAGLGLFARRRAALRSPPRLDARVKLGCLLALVLTAAMLPGRAPGPLLALLLLAGGLAVATRVPLGWLLQRAAVLLPFLLLVLAAPLGGALGGTPLPPPAPGEVPHWASLLARALTSLLATAAFVAGTPEPEVVAALRAWRLPGPLADTMAFGLRYFRVTADDAGRMLRARAARGPGLGSLALRARSTGGLVGSLWVRSFGRAERVGAAMAARGFTGRLPAAARPTPRPADWAVLAGFCLLLLGVWLWR